MWGVLKVTIISGVGTTVVGEVKGVLETVGGRD